MLNIGLKLAFDSSGNIYVVDGLVIRRFVKSLGYTSQTFYTLVSGTDYNPSGANVNQTVNILGIQIDASNNVHILIGSNGGTSGVGIPGQGFLSRTVIDSSGTRIKTDLALQVVPNPGGGGEV